MILKGGCCLMLETEKLCAGTQNVYVYQWLYVNEKPLWLQLRKTKQTSKHIHKKMQCE